MQFVFGPVLGFDLVLDHQLQLYQKVEVMVVGIVGLVPEIVEVIAGLVAVVIAVVEEIVELVLELMVVGIVVVLGMLEVGAIVVSQSFPTWHATWILVAVEMKVLDLELVEVASFHLVLLVHLVVVLVQIDYQHTCQ